MKNALNTCSLSTLTEKSASSAMIPIGSFEQHGKHLLVTTDSIIATALSKAICDKYHGLLVPTIGVCCSHEHTGFDGTLSISSETLFKTVKDTIVSLEQFNPQFN